MRLNHPKRRREKNTAKKFKNKKVDIRQQNKNSPLIITPRYYILYSSEWNYTLSRVHFTHRRPSFASSCSHALAMNDEWNNERTSSSLRFLRWMNCNELARRSTPVSTLHFTHPSIHSSISSIHPPSGSFSQANKITIRATSGQHFISSTTSREAAWPATAAPRR